MQYCVRWGFNIGGSADTTVGRVASWTSAKTIKVQVNRYSSNYPGVLHETNHWDAGGSSDIFVAPTLTAFCSPLTNKIIVGIPFTEN